jgi:hypothetical protein
MHNNRKPAMRTRMPRNKMTFVNINQIGLGIGVFLVGGVIGFTALLLLQGNTTMTASQNLTLTMQECCNGSYCTDTSYDPNTNTCHLTLCDAYQFPFKGKCTYPGITDLRVIA